MKRCHKGKGPHLYDNSLRTCPECKKKSAREWAARKRNNDPEWSKAQHRKYCNKARDAAYARRHRLENPDCAKTCCNGDQAYKRRYYLKNRERFLKAQQVRYAAKKSKILKSCAEYKRRNPHIVAAYCQKRRSIKQNAEGHFTAHEWLAIQAAQENRCRLCGVECRLTVDHIIPLSRGGSNWISNIQGLCMPCNSAKGAKIMETA